MRHGLKAVILALVVLGLGSSCNTTQTTSPARDETVSKTSNTGPEDVDIWFRDGDLNAMTEQPLVEYTDMGPGDSEEFGAAFFGAPPQIPHSVEDMLPISLDENMCLDCHLPENIDDDTPAIPLSHFTMTVMAKGGHGDTQVWKVAGQRTTDLLQGTRFNCTLCHTPQSTNTPAMEYLRN